MPTFVLKGLREWVLGVEEYGLPKLRKVKGYHDELLKGDRKGQRSVRFNRQRRVI